MEDYWYSYAASFFVFIGTILVFLYYKIQKKYRYFLERGIPFVKPTFLFGSSWKFITLQIPIEEQIHELYEKLKDHKFGGFYQFLTPVFIVNDPELVERITIKDFSYFSDHFEQNDTELEPMNANLFNLKGQQWKILRSKLSAFFTSGRLKWMFDQVVTCCDNLIEKFDKIATGEDVEYKQQLSTFTLDVIASCAFGVDTSKGSNSEFYEMSSKIFKHTKLQFAKLIFMSFFPKLAKLLKFQVFEPDVRVFFTNLTKDAINFRIENNTERKDFVQLLLQLKQKGFVDEIKTNDPGDDEINRNTVEEIANSKFEFTDEVLTAQSLIFIVAGLETSSTLLAYTLYTLSTHPETQDKVRNEIKTNIESHSGINYESLKNMTYLECVFSETLRLYPPSGIIIRACTKDYKVDDKRTIEKNSAVVIPSYSLHRDERYFKEPEKFIPERFIDSKCSINKSCGYYLPFGDGPRVCIARRFAIIEAKIAMIKILLNYELKRSPKNIEPLKRNPQATTVIPIGGLYIRIEKLK